MVPSENPVKRMRCGEKRMSTEEGLKKKRCPKTRMPRERGVNGKRLKQHRFQETAMTWEKACQERRVCQASAFKAVDKKGCVRSKPDQEKVAASGKDVESKKCQGQRLPRDHAVDGRASQAVRGRFYSLSLVFIGSSLSRNFRHPACPGSTWRGFL